VLKTSFFFPKRLKSKIFFSLAYQYIPQKKVTAEDAEDGAEDAEGLRCQVSGVRREA
jgi:hypothetical protein